MSPNTLADILNRAEKITRDMLTNLRREYAKDALIRASTPSVYWR